MRQREVMGAISGAAVASPHAERVAPLPDAATEGSVQKKSKISHW